MKEGALIRLLIVALRAGLLLMGVGAMVDSNFRQKESDLDPTEAIRLETAALNRRPVSREHLATLLDILATRIGERHPGKPEQLEKAAVWIESSLSGANLGYRVERQTYEAEGNEVRNLIAELPGRERRDEIIVVGAHYDSVAGSPGANDNGTGVVALLSLARAFAGEQQTRTIRFVAFVNGAPPYFQTEAMGSLVYVNRCKARGEKIIVMLGLDSLGDLYGGGTVSISGSEDSSYFIDSALQAFSIATSLPAQREVFPVKGADGKSTDHVPFSQVRYPTVDVFAKKVPGVSHPGDVSDTLDAVDLGTLEGSTLGIEAVLRAWANP